MPTVKMYWTQRQRFEAGPVVLDTEVPLAEADGVFCFLSPNQAFLEFEGPKVWYAYEVLSHSRYRREPLWRACFEAAGDGEFLHFAARRPQDRLPHLTCFDETPWTVRDGRHESAAVAVVSNFGGRFWALKPGTRRRNSFILDPAVKLFGKRSAWSGFRGAGGLAQAGPPANYCGETPTGGYTSHKHLRFLSDFKVNVCLENTSEQDYFTEKFVGAARAGCIPVYAAHESVSAGVLQGARWVDPADFGFDPVATLKFALSQDRTEYAEANWRWLASGAVDASCVKAIWREVADRFAAQFAGAEQGKRRLAHV